AQCWHGRLRTIDGDAGTQDQDRQQGWIAQTLPDGEGKHTGYEVEAGNYTVRIKPVHRPAYKQGADDTAELKQATNKCSTLHGSTGFTHQRGQPTGQQINNNQSHEIG